jgi:hypothetical protein
VSVAGESPETSGSDIQSSKIFEDEILKKVFENDYKSLGYWGHHSRKDVEKLIREAINLTKRKMGED